MTKREEMIWQPVIDRLAKAIQESGIFDAVMSDIYKLINIMAEYRIRQRI